MELTKKRLHSEILLKSSLRQTRLPGFKQNNSGPAGVEAE